MVADASHEVYVDTILDTIREAAKKRGTGIAERTHEYVATKMKEGKAIIALCGNLLPPGTPPLAVGQDIQPYQRRGRHEDEHRTGLCTRHFQRADRRRGFLERM